MTSRWTLAVRVLCLLLTVALAAPVATPADPVRTFVTLIVNTEASGEALIVLEGNDVFLDAAAAKRVKLPLANAQMHRYDDGDFVSMRSLAPKVSYRFDQDSLVLELTLSPDLFGTSVVRFNNAAPGGISYPHDRSAFLNYSVSTDTFAGTSGFAETGATIGAGRAYTSFFDNSTTGFARGLTNLTFDSRQAMRTTVIGDALATGGELGGNPFLAGLQVGRAFDLNPYFVQFPTLNFSGSMTAPGRADVYLNGVLVRSVPLAPGQFSLQGITPPSGAGTTQVVVTNSLGQSTVLGGPYYAAGSLLRAGLTDYQYSAGFLRTNAFSPQDRYGDFGWVGRYRIGVTDNLSTGARFEGSTGGLLSGGPVLDLGTRLGTFHVGGAVSRDGGIKGAAADLGWSYSSPRFELSGTMQYESAGYATTSLSPQTDRPITSSAFAGSYQVSRRLSLSLEVSHAVYRDSGEQTNASAFVGFSLGDVSMNVGIDRTSGVSALGLTSNGTSYFMTMLLTGRGRTSENVAMTSSAGKTTSTLQVQQGLPAGIGFGYRAAFSNDPGSLFNGDARYNGAYGTYELTSGTSRNGRSDANLTVAGGIADVDGKIALSRPLTNSFALVEVPNQQNVHVFLNGQDMGTTSRAGYLVVPDVVPYYDNHIRIDEPATSFNTEIIDGNQNIAPGLRSGALVTYGVRNIVAFTGKVVVRKRTTDVVPAAGQLELSLGGKTFDSDLGDDGQFYFDNLDPATYDGLIRYAGGSCALRVTVPKSSRLLNDLGTLVCAQ